MWRCISFLVIFAIAAVYFMELKVLQLERSSWSLQATIGRPVIPRSAVSREVKKAQLKFLEWKKSVIMNRTQRKPTSGLQILLWTNPYILRSLYYAHKGVFKTCNVKCGFTTNTTLIDTVDAVVITSYDRTRYENCKYLVCVHCQQRNNNSLSSVLPRQSKKNQIRVFLTREPPVLLHLDGLPYYYQPFLNKFNWTMTYRLDSDVPAHFGGFRLQRGKNRSNFNIEGFHDKAHYKLYKERYLRAKTKSVAWIASNCITASRREIYVQELQKYTQVDIYGACGTFNCSISRRQRDKSGQVESCFAELGVQYKFFLSFENSLCVDYVTEKLFFALNNGMVPVVYGGANYSLFAPPHSYINALEFGSPKKLADYLHFLDQNDSEYLKYFLWTERYEIFGAVNRWCRLCQKLWSLSITSELLGVQMIDPQYTKMYENVTKWWWFTGENSTVPACRKPPKYLKIGRPQPRPAL